MNIATKIRAASPVVVAWDADRAVTDLFTALRDITAISERMTELHHARPDVGADGFRSGLGRIVGMYVTDWDRQGRQVWTVTANGGVCADIWEKLGQRRDAWIDAQLQDEGFPDYAWSDAKFERRGELADLAGTVEAAWLAFGESGK